MTKEISLKELEVASRALIEARETNLGIEITMPVIYPDGQSVTVVVTVEGGEYIVHDAGFGTMYLTNSGVRFTKILRERLHALAAHYGCDFIDGRMTRRCEIDQIALAVAVVANASRTIGDQALDARRRTEDDFRRNVSDALKEIMGSRVRTRQEVKGKSGRTYQVQNIVLDKTEKTALAFVEIITNRTSALRHFAEFYDLKGIHQATDNLSVYDRNEDLRKADIKLLSDVSDPINFTQARKRFQRYREAA